jgi:ribonuclease BN (tRNA processing enzyme)
MDKKETGTLNRRGFIKTAALGAVTVSATASSLISASQVQAAPAPPAGEKAQMPKGFQVITIGVSGPPMDIPNKDRTWPATLVQFQDKYFLVDCGGAATHGILKAGINPADVKNILFTHHHADHNSDYFTFAIGGWNGPGGRRSLNVVGPSHTKDLHEMMLKYYEEDLTYRMNYGFPPEGLKKNVNIKEIEGSETFELDGVKITSAEGIHTMYNLGYRFEAGGQSVVVTGDTAYSEKIVKLAQDADILVIDAHMAEGVFSKNVLKTEEQRDNMRKAHMSNEDIAMTASKANVKTVILSHLPPLPLDEKATFQALRDAGFKGKIIVGKTLGRYPV